MIAAAGVAGDGAAKRADAGDDGGACGAFVGMIPGETAGFEGQRMADGFSGNSEVVACGPPFRAVGCDFSATGALICEKVGEFVLEGAPDFLFGDAFELGIQLDFAGRPPGAAGGGAHARIPCDGDFAGEIGMSEREGGVPAPCGEGGIGVRVPERAGEVFIREN